MIFYAAVDVIGKAAASVKYANIEADTEDDARRYARELGTTGLVFTRNNDTAWPTVQLRRQDGKLEARKRTTKAPEWGSWEAVR